MAHVAQERWTNVAGSEGYCMTPPLGWGREGQAAWQITTCPPPLYDKQRTARRGQAAGRGTDAAGLADGPGPGQRAAQDARAKPERPEVRHKPRPTSRLGNRAKVRGIASHDLPEGDRLGLDDLGASGPGTAPGPGVQQHGRSAPVVVERRTDLLHAPEVRDRDVRPATPLLGLAAMAAGPEAQVAQEGAEVAVGVEILPILTGVGENRHQ